MSAYASLVAIALIMRLWDLGSRAVHHDESLHGFFSWQLYRGDGFTHNPLMHGTFLFEGTAGMFLLFGDNEFSLRLLPALFGTALVLLPLLLRSRLGNIGAIVVATLLAFSPTLFYFSRFARNDIFMAVWTLALVAVMWRYLDERRPRWLYAAAALLALGFATKETQFLVVAILAIALLALSAGDVGRWIWGQRSLREWGAAGSFLLLLIGLSLPMFGAVFGIFQESLGITLAATDAGAAGSPGLAPGEPQGAGLWIAGAITGVLLLIGVGALMRWRAGVGLRALAIYWFLFMLLFTTVGTNPGGAGTGVWQSLGYWLAQQDVARGSQPWYYYFMAVSVYEFLPWTVAIGAAGYFTLRGDHKPVWLSAIAGTIALVSVIGAIRLAPSGDAVQADGTGLGLGLVLAALVSLAFLMLVNVRERDRFTRFLVYWAIGTFIAYTVSAEKMPWLLANITLPLIVLAGKAMGDVLAAVQWRRVVARGALFIVAGVPLFLVLLWRLIFYRMEQRDLPTFIELWALLAVVALLLIGLYVMTRRIGRKPAFSLVLIALVGMMGALTLRAGWIATYVNSDEPREILIYTQTAPDIPNLMNEIQTAGVLTGERAGLNVTIDSTDGFTWPWAWYLRNYDNVGYPAYRETGAPPVPPKSAVTVVNAKNNPVLAETFGESFTPGRKIVHRWWFPEDYRDLTPGEFFGTIVDRDRWRTAIDFFLYRQFPSPIGGVDSYVYFDEDIPLQALE